MSRTCGSCKMCCYLLPVRELDKGANQRCKHECAGGCAVYQRSAMPDSCHLWNCMWLIRPENTANVQRPDIAGFVIDVVPDFITVIHPETQAHIQLPVVQVWVDPTRPDAHRDPALRAYLERCAAGGYAAMIRYSEREGFVLFAPLFGGGQWREVAGRTTDRTHTAEEIIGVLHNHG